VNVNVQRGVLRGNVLCVAGWMGKSGFPKIQMAVPAWQGQYSTTVTRQQGWQEEEAWRTSDGLGTQRHMASNGARPFGRTAALSEHENLARTNGHSTAHLTSWGHVRTWDTQRTDLTANDRATRRSAVPPPNTDAMRQTLKGEGLADGAAEPVVLMSGHAIKPGGQGVHGNALGAREMTEPELDYGADIDDDIDRRAAKRRHELLSLRYAYISIS
jgi:hypothetical protein